MLKNVPVSSFSELLEGYYDHPNRTGLTTEEFVDMGEHSCLSPPPDGNQPPTRHRRSRAIPTNAPVDVHVESAR